MQKTTNSKKIKKRIAIISVCAVACTLVLVCAIYGMRYYHAVDVERYMQGNDAVTVTEISKGYFFDGPGNERALIFYPGAKVEETAYAPMLSMLAEQGIDCFLVKMPEKLAIWGFNRADDILSKYDYKHWYMAGHSLGGAMAAKYLGEHPDAVEGVVFLAAFSAEDLRDAPYWVLGIYGTNDEVCSEEKWKSFEDNLPANHQNKMIDGGNHCGFGSYGHQKGDGERSIEIEKQWKETVDAIVSKINQEEKE